ncbi:MAG: D-alanyl-D-alanine carboxypeptidase [Thermosynechococcaceae cyanobacterium MS004]|nr:D-alanyl-D-alanine carboxypeptidase [Thermosynechococcaceae cyanobacterium MS004]
MIAELLSSSLLGVWLTKAGHLQPPSPSGQDLSTMVLQSPDSDRDQVLKTYLNQLAQQGFDPARQAIWMQSDRGLLINHQGQQRQTPASLTKLATTLSLLKTLGAKHTFKTQIFGSGPVQLGSIQMGSVQMGSVQMGSVQMGSIQNGVLQGDLIVQGNGDPLLLTPELITIGNQLNQLGIRRVTGNLILQGAITINLSEDLSAAAGELREIWHSPSWGEATRQAYASLPKNTPKPTLVIEGQTFTDGAGSSISGSPLLTHTSVPLPEVLRLMNVYSSNAIAEWLAQLVGGAEVLNATALQTDQIAPKELALTNGSGLGQDNKLSPRAAVGLLQAIQAELSPHGLTLADVLPVSGRDRGTVEKRTFPTAAVKTGTLWNTSGLAGVLTTQRYGRVWFAIMNDGDDYTDGFRNAQDTLLKKLAMQWGGVPKSETQKNKQPTDSQQPTAIAPAPQALPPLYSSRYQALDRFMQQDFLTR